ncbi:MAG: hypothetical protein JWL92_660 [Candidatus Nomurabacteria bacterium]|nr:hypothetical protein [Candidatus Nomurabacteria bacterium]
MKLSFPKVFFIISSVIFLSIVSHVLCAHAEELRAVPSDLTLNPDITYTISGTIYVNHDSTLTVPAGTTILFDKAARLVVYGKLDVKGTTQDHVVFARGNMAAARFAIPAEVETAQVVPLEIDSFSETPEVNPVEVPALNVSMGTEMVTVDDKAGSIVFMNGSLPSSLKYLDISDFSIATLVDTSAIVTMDHMTFKNCATGIENTFGTVNLTHSTFIDTAIPGQISVNAVFEHSDTTFSGTGFKGWNYAGKVAGEFHLRSKDGQYYAAGLEVINGGSLYFNFGTTLFIPIGIAIEVHEYGKLFINGTALSPVTIYGEGNCLLNTPAVNYAFQSTGSIAHANFHNLCTGIKSVNATVTVTNSTFKDIKGSAIHFEQAGLLTITDTDISKSGIAIELVDSANIKNISQNTFHDNKVGVSLNNLYPNAIIKNNRWGSNSGPTIASNPTGTGDSILVSGVPEVIYRPWLGMEDGEPTTPDNPPEEPPVEARGHDPIIIVPGITGSVLRKDYDDNGELWPNLTKLVANLADSHLDVLALLQTGKPSAVRPMVVGDIIRSVSSVDIFGGLIGNFNNNGYVEGTNLFVLPYDWRFSNAENQSKLKDLIATALEKSGKSKVNIIAHSMGGLLVKEYLAENQNAPVAHIFNIAVPHLGAPKTFKTLMYGDDMGFKFSLTSALKVPVLNENRVKMITQNMPSVYELLPSKKYIDLLGPYIDDRTQGLMMDIENTQKLMVADGRNAKMFPFAQALHNRIDNITGSSIPTYNFAGCGSTETVVGFTLTKEQSLTLTGFKLVPEHRFRYGAGDGVVPVRSAVAVDGAHNYYVTTGSHGTMPSLAAIQDAILAIAGGRSVSGLSDSASSCNVPGTIVEVHSPVSLDIYDQQGNHTGLTNEGEIEYGIPNVQYDVINDEKSAFLPVGINYTVVNHAEAAGTYDMYVTHLNQEDTVDHQLYYHAVPLVNEKSTSTFAINTNNINPVISIDDNGDTVADRTVNSSSSLDASKVQDSIAPITNASVDDSLVALIATDDNAGVLNTKYSTDNVVWNLYTKPFKALVGTTVYFVSIDNAGNTEDIKQVVVGAPVSSNGGNSVTPPSSTVGTATNIPVKTPNVPEKIPEKTIDDDKKEKEIHIASDNISRTYLTAPAPDEGTVMSDNQITKNSLLASLATVAGIGSTAVIIIGVLTVVGIGLFVVFSKKGS